MKPRKPFWDNLIGCTVYVTLNLIKFAYFALAYVCLRPKKQ